ncbi:MAG: hypothetical protein VX834_06295, partial [Myxococcota bacterium]|nr:hypothetical protein [Myxococcota bacterium]
DLLCVELSHIKGIEVRCKSDIDTLLQHTSNRQLLGCRDDGCLVELSDALGADFLLHGSISQLGRTLALIVSRVSSRGGAQSAHFKETVTGELDTLLGVVHRAARELSRDIAQSADVKPAHEDSAVSISPSLEASLRAFVEAWRVSWQQTVTTQSLDAYAGFYSKRFYSEYAGKDYEAWMADKARKLRKKSAIAVTLGPQRIYWAGGDEYTVTFLQTYQSSNYSDRGLKILRLRRQVDSWKIIAEEWRSS